MYPFELEMMERIDRSIENLDRDNEIFDVIMKIRQQIPETVDDEERSFLFGALLSLIYKLRED